MSGDPVAHTAGITSDLLCDLIHLGGLRMDDVPLERHQAITYAMRMPMGTFLVWMGGTSEWVTP